MASITNNNTTMNNSDTVPSVTNQNVTYADALRKIGHDTDVSNDNSEDANLNRDVSSEVAEGGETGLNDSIDEDSRNSTKWESFDNHVSECSEAVEVSALYDESADGSALYDESSSLSVEAYDVSALSKEVGEASIISEEITEISSNFEGQRLSDTFLSSSDETKTSLIVEENSSGELSEKGSSSDEDEESSEEMMNAADIYPSALKWQLREVNPKLPNTVTVLEAAGGSKVYLVGTVHFSYESQDDVSLTIRSTHPDVVLIELCKNRINMLSLDEATVLEEVKNMNFDKIRTVIQQNGFVQGVLHLLLLNMSAYLTKQLGIAPGGEFRKAFTEAKKVPGCIIHLGDRPIQVTLQRALATLSVWKKIKMGWYLLANKEPISKEDVEKCKQRDLLEQTLAEMTGEFPEMSKVFIRERDIYLTYSLQVAASAMASRVAPRGVEPRVVVGVVGIGHVPGIVANWGTVTENDIIPLLSIPKQSRSSRIIRTAMKYTMYGVVLYGCYRLIPKKVLQVPFRAFTSLLRKK